MELIHRIDCPDGRDCPAIFATGRGTVVLRGDRLARDDHGEMNLPGHETAIELTPEVLEELFRAYRDATGCLHRRTPDPISVPSGAAGPL